MVVHLFDLPRLRPRGYAQVLANSSGGGARPPQRKAASDGPLSLGQSARMRKGVRFEALAQQPAAIAQRVQIERPQRRLGARASQVAPCLHHPQR